MIYDKPVSSLKSLPPLWCVTENTWILETRGQHPSRKYQEAHCCILQIPYSSSNFTGTKSVYVGVAKKRLLKCVYDSTSKPDAGGTHLFLVILL